MKAASVFWLAVIPLLAEVVGAWQSPSAVPKNGPVVASSFKRSPVVEVTGYRQWTRVNPKPALFHAATAVQCAAPFPSQQASPHRDKYITVFVNPVGRTAMLRQKSPHFPVGSVIVKEKRTEKDSIQPELLTVIKKRAKGFNPVTDDWEYLVLDGTATKVQARGKIESCQNCHVRTKRTDYVFRDSYLPQSLIANLR